MTKNTRLTVQLIVAIIVVVVGCSLLIAGFIVPPVGIIDNSILVAYGEVSTFAGALLGIDYSYRYKMFADSKGKSTKD